MTENKTIYKCDFNKEAADDYYFDCRFESCDFSELILEKMVFENCVFVNCNCSNTTVQCRFSEVQFVDCKMMGADFSEMNKYSVSLRFRNCILSYACFINANLREAVFSDCRLTECNFTGTDLKLARFEHCDFSRSVFSVTNLEKADLESSRHFDINPNENKTKGMIVSESELRGLVSYLNIVIR